MKTLNEDIKTGNFKPVYLLYGEEAYLKKQYRDRITKAIFPDGDTVNYAYYEGKGINPGELIDLAETMPFFADRRLIVIENSGFFKNASPELADYIKTMPDTACFLFVENEADKRGKMYKAVKSKGRVVEMARQDEKTLLYWVAGNVKKEGYKIKEQTARYLLSTTGTDMENLEKMQNIILKSQDISAYLTPVDERLKREERPEYRYFFALLQEQLIMMMEGKKDFNLENVLRKIYGTEYTPVQAVRAALELLLSTERLQLFEADAIRNAAGNGILRLAAREPEAFANNDVAASYQLLKEDTVRELNLGRFLNRLDDEWKSIYCKRYGGRVSRREYRESYDRPEQRRPYPGSARTRYELDEDEEMDEEDESSPIILIIAAVVALLVGVAISLVLCLLVPDKITMAISIGLILVGITGDIVIIIHNIIASKRRER